MEKHKNTKEAYTDRSKNIDKRLSFAAVYIDVTRRGALLLEVSIQTAEMTAIKIVFKETTKEKTNNG